MEVIVKVPVLIVKDDFTFESCHQLVENYEGPCERLHGHSYKLSIAVESIPDEAGMVINFKELKELVEETIIRPIDHQNLNEVMPEIFSMKGNTTCENIIVAFWWALDHLLTESGVTLRRLQLHETAHNYAVLTRGMVYRGY